MLSRVSGGSYLLYSVPIVPFIILSRFALSISTVMKINFALNSLMNLFREQVFVFSDNFVSKQNENSRELLEAGSEWSLRK